MTDAQANGILAAIKGLEDRMEERFEAVDQRFEAMGSRFGTLEEAVGSLALKLDGLNDKVDLHYQEFREFQTAMNGRSS